MTDEKWLTWEEGSKPVAIGEASVTLASRALQVRWPNGGLVWNRPASVTIERDGGTESIPIVDVTRQAQLALLAMAIVFTLLGIIAGGRRGKRNA